MTLRTKIFILLSLFALVVLGIAILMLVTSKKKNADTTDQFASIKSEVIDSNNFKSPEAAPVSPSSNVQANTAPQKISPEETIKIGVQQLAKVFVERYSSYSTDGNYGNIREVKTLVTDSLWNILSKKLEQPAIQSDFIGITTKAIASDIISLSVDSAKVNLQVVQEENRSGKISTFHKTIDVILVKDEPDWLVDKFEWKNF